MLQFVRSLSDSGAHSTPTSPIPRFGKSDEIANVVAFLLSDERGFVTGATWAVDGGVNVSIEKLRAGRKAARDRRARDPLSAPFSPGLCVHAGDEKGSGMLANRGNKPIKTNHQRKQP
jgi:hypothetical protein